MINHLKTALARRPLPALSPALLQSLLPLLLLAIGISAIVLMYFWRDQSSFKPVFGAREKVAVTDMMAALDAEHIAYRLHPDSGQVLVPESALGKVRMLLAAKGVMAQMPAGLELMDKNDPLGVSQFVQDVRFRRGLEGELAQSIMTLDPIGAARVHLSIAKSTSFISSDGEKSSASVVLNVKRGRTLAPEQIAAIVNLVAGSVASLAPQRVSVVDQAGNYLSSRIDLSEGFDASGNGNEGARRVQEEIRGNVRELLGPVIGEDNFKLSVTAAVNNDRIEETLEKYGEAPKVTSEAMREEMERNRLVMGVPGTLSNRPPAAPEAGTDSAAAVTGTSAKPDEAGARRNATTRQYAYDRSITQIKRSRGSVQKLSVAVVLNHRAAPTAPKNGWSAAELANIDKMLRSGLGIDSGRGDVLAVSALTFPAKAPVGEWWEERDNVVDMSNWAMYALGALFGFLLIVRPLMRLLTARLAPPLMAQPSEALLAQAPVSTAALSPGVSAALGAPVAADEALATGEPIGAAMPLLENYDLPPPGSAVDVMINHLKILAEKEPERVAEVVKQWMQKNGRTQ